MLNNRRNLTMPQCIGAGLGVGTFVSVMTVTIIGVIMICRHYRKGHKKQVATSESDDDDESLDQYELQNEEEQPIYEEINVVHI